MKSLLDSVITPLYLPLLVLLLPAVNLIHAKLACISTTFCESTLRPGSRCVDGYCDNPFQYGCLRSHIAGFEKLRVCHSEDSPDAAENGLCRDVSDRGLDYSEIRIMSQNWESPFFEAWILQILLSEILDVPTTIETGSPDANVNFYNPESRFEYGVGYDMEGLERASQVLDCRNVEQIEGEAYKGCGHAILEIWSGQEDVILDLLDKGAVEPKSFIGVVGEEGWQIPKFTAEKDSSLLSHFGLAGEENRRKVAERFLHPTTWGEYCTEVAPEECIGDNNSVAVRPPESLTESEKFFEDGLYMGHFRKTELNDCDKWPHNCTGHFLDYPCGWTSFFIQQAHHLNVSLQSNGDEPGSSGYSYSHMLEIWYAANWTKSDVIGWWWRPEALYQQFQGTDFELQRVSLPPTNHRCIENRMNIKERCGPDNALRVGNREGSCDVPPIPNYKLLSSGLYQLVYDSDKPEALKSPAYDVLKEFRIDGFSLGKIFEYWLERKTDRYGYDPREAVCQWVVENLDELRRFIPRSYPRELQEKEEHITSKVAIGLGGVAAAATIAAVVFTYRHRNRRVFQFAQVEFVFLLLIGILCVSGAAILTAIDPTDGGCLATVWLLNVGYTLELAPLVVKIAAINRLMQAAMRMKRIKLSRTFLFGIVAALMGIVFVYLIIWSIIDRPLKSGSYSLSGEVTDAGSTVVSVVYFCESDSPLWRIIAVGTQALLLLCASILAFLTRKMREDVNEANTISFLIYWNFVCVLLRVILLMLGGSVDVSLLNRSLSMILSADSLATILIYFVPKFYSKDTPRGTGNNNDTVNFVNVGLPQIWGIDEGSSPFPSQRRSSILLSNRDMTHGKASHVSFAGQVSVVGPTNSRYGFDISDHQNTDRFQADDDDTSNRVDDPPIRPLPMTDGRCIPQDTDSTLHDDDDDDSDEKRRRDTEEGYVPKVEEEQERAPTTSWHA